MRTAFALMTLTLSASIAPAQFSGSTSVLSPYQTPNGGFRPVYTNGGFVPGYGGVFIQDPIGGALNGTANLVSSYGQYGIDFQQSRLMNQDVERSKLNTRKAFIEQQMWEQSLQPTAEDIRLKNMDLELRRSMNSPPLGEIVSGVALNSLLTNILQLQAKGAYGPQVPLDQNMLKHINLAANPGQSVAMFKDGGKLRFPFVLRDTPFDSDREKIQDLVFTAVKETQADELSPATIRNLRAATASLNAKVEQAGRTDMPLGDIIQAQRFINELTTATAALQSGNAGRSLNRTWVAQGRSVGDLVAYMSTNGLRFAAAQQGEESFYRALHQALVTYSFGMQTARR